MKLHLGQYWEKLSPKYRQGAIYAAALGGLLLLAYLFVSSGEKKKGLREEKKVQREVFAPQRLETRFGIPGLARELEEMKHQNQELKTKVDQLLKSREGRQEQDPAKLRTQMEQLVEQRLREIKKQEPQFPPSPGSGSHGPSAKGPVPQAPAAQGPGKGQKPPDWLPGKGLSEQLARPSGAPAPPGAPLAALHQAKDIRVITAASSQKAESGGASGTQGRIEAVQTLKKEKAKVEEKGTFVPAGSIFSGTLLTGMDVPCGKEARRDPFPALLRVKKEAILPNRYTADVRECFLVASGYGDLSSERAYLRSERLSCIRADGKALETRIESYSVGEDGKAGIRGRLVSKQGAIIGKALLVGFMEGFSKIFSQTPVTALQIGQPGAGLTRSTPFQNYLSRDAMEGAGISGVGSALDRLAKYYLDMAQNIFPVVEVDAGRQIDFVLVSGATLKLQGKI